MPWTRHGRCEGRREPTAVVGRLGWQSTEPRFVPTLHLAVLRTLAAMRRRVRQQPWPCVPLLRPAARRRSCCSWQTCCLAQCIALTALCWRAGRCAALGVCLAMCLGQRQCHLQHAWTSAGSVGHVWAAAAHLPPCAALQDTGRSHSPPESPDAVGFKKKLGFLGFLGFDRV
jgi:hypothetical protein